MSDQFIKLREGGEETATQTQQGLMSCCCTAKEPGNILAGMQLKELVLMGSLQFSAPSFKHLLKKEAPPPVPLRVLQLPTPSCVWK